jgi:hypothetical protein
MALAQAIAERIHGLRYEDLTPTALEWTRAAFSDTAGVTLAGIVEDGPRILLRVPGIAAASGPSLIFASHRRTSPLDAALVNGTASHALDYDDVSGVLGGHPSVMLIPAMLALAELIGANGRDLAVAYVVGSRRNAAWRAACISITTIRVGIRLPLWGSLAPSRRRHGCCGSPQNRLPWRSAWRRRWRRG